MNKLTKTLLLSIAIIGLYLSSTAHPIDFDTAKAVAAKFMENHNLQLAATYRTDKNVAAFYVFNSTDGFVIVAADNCETPIIGYSHEGCFDPNNVPIQLQGYLQDFAARIQYGIENQITADEVTARQWELVKTTGKLNENKSAKAVAPLLTDKWHQGCLYNSLCPTMDGPCDHAEVGCVAVAMAQIMHYWSYPTNGWGSHFYSNAGSTLSANFGNTTYDWIHMPDSLTAASSDEEIEAVATLLFHCGVSVEMGYGVNGSLANSSSIPDALIRHFNYSRQLHREKKKNYSNQEWITLLKNCLDLQRPIQYSGFGVGIGHAFVCDGYDGNDLLHFNWGWGGTADGYFALGNLHPLGYNLNDSNYAIIDIIPQYDPCLVVTTAYPPLGGTVEGAGEYHIGAQCTLTAIPKEGYELYCWKKNGQVLSNTPSITIGVESDTINIEALFSALPIGQITASYAPDANNPSSPTVSLSWSYAETEWNLLKQFEIGEETGGMTTDGEHIYITYAEWNSPPFLFGKYTMDGELVERFNIEGLPKALCLAYDGTSFYCNSGHSGLSVIYRIDLDNKMVLDTIDMGLWFGALTYDPEYDGFWLGRNYQTILFNRQGHRIQDSPMTNDYLNGTGYYIAADGTPRLILSRESGVYDYDIHNDFISDHPLLSMGEEINSSLGTCTGQYDGKNALFIIVNDVLRIYEINSTFGQIPQILSYRIYRSDSQSNTIMLADEIAGLSYIDTTWDNAPVGFYRFGISSVFANGIESEIIWSNPIEKTNIGIDENAVEFEHSVQKVIENGQIIIIKKEKRYNISGQRLN